MAITKERVTEAREDSERRHGSDQEDIVTKAELLELLNCAEYVLRDGHGRPCHYCSEPCNGFAGDPGRWPLGFCQPDGTGIIRWHHTRCVTHRLVRLGELEARIATIADEANGPHPVQSADDSLSEIEREIFDARLMLQELETKRALAIEMISELRGYCASWDWKYGDGWDKQQKEIER